MRFTKGKAAARLDEKGGGIMGFGEKPARSILAMAMSLSLCVSMVPLPAFAVEDDQEIDVTLADKEQPSASVAIDGATSRENGEAGYAEPVSDEEGSCLRNHAGDGRCGR